MSEIPENVDFTFSHAFLDIFRERMLFHSKEEWAEYRKDIVDEYPYLMICNILPPPAVIKYWKLTGYIDGFIFLFDASPYPDEAQTEILDFIDKEIEIADERSGEENNTE